MLEIVLICIVIKAFALFVPSRDPAVVGVEYVRLVRCLIVENAPLAETWLSLVGLAAANKHAHSEGSTLLVIYTQHVTACLLAI